jgi:hypothetical protein
MHVVVGKPEMMADLVHHDMVDQRFERHAGVHPFVEQRAAIEVDLVGHGHPVPGRFLADRAPAIQAGQVERILDAHLVEGLVIGEILDHQHDVGEIGVERLGDARKGGAGEALDRCGVWGLPGHVARNRPGNGATARRQ